MKIPKILSLAAISAGLLLSSCSMNREANNTSYLQSGKLEAQQQLTTPNAPKQHLAVIDASQNQQATQSDMISAPSGSGQVQAQRVQHHSRSFAQSNLIKRAGKTLAQVITVPKAIGTINSMIKKPAATASAKANPFAGMNYLMMWIICLVASILLYALGALLGPIGIVFDILGLIAGIFFIIFLILWILQIAQG